MVSVAFDEAIEYENINDKMHDVDPFSLTVSASTIKVDSFIW